MEFFRDAYSVRLMGHTGKYLWAHEDRKSVSQKRGKDAYGVIWRVELVQDRSAIRLKSVYDLYLMASDYAFLLGATGKKVLQSFASKADSSLEWEPVADGTYVKLMTKGEKFLRANGGIYPYHNSVTHDVPVLASNQHVVRWEVEVVRKRDAPSLTPSRVASPRQSSASSRAKSPPAPPPPPQPQAESSEEDDIPAPPRVPAPRPRARAAPAPRRRHEEEEEDDHHDDYSPSSSEQGSPPPRRRRSPPTEALHNTRIGRRRGSPPREARYDPSPPPPRSRARADPGLPPSDASSSPPPPPRRGARHGHRAEPPRRLPTRDEDEASHSGASSPRRSLDADEGSARSSARARDVRRIFYSVAEDDGEVLAIDDETYGTFMFRGQSLDELTEEVQRVTNIHDDIILCMRNPLSAKLYRMRLALPQNNAPLSVVIVRSNSQFGRTFSAQPSRQR